MSGKLIKEAFERATRRATMDRQDKKSRQYDQQTKVEIKSIHDIPISMTTDTSKLKEYQRG